MKEIKKIINIENILCIYIILCPILDIISFLFRNTFNTNISPSTIIRPIIPIMIIIYMFFKKGKQFKINLIIIGTIYLLYGIIHMYIFKGTITKSSYGNLMHEMQYIINYTFMIINLLIYVYIFKQNKNIEKLSKSILIANAIYIASIFISILTKTSSSTYIEKIGYKGWFESGNSIGAILILSLFIIMKYVKNKKYNKIAIPIILLEGIFLSFLLGTRVGLLGFIIVAITYMIAEVVTKLIQNKKASKKTLAFGISIILIIMISLIAVGSTTIKRRNHLKEIEKNIVEPSNNKQSHITGSLLEIKEKIDNKELENGYMTKEEEKSIIDLYNIANELKIKNNDQRMQQLIYNIELVKNQHNFIYLLFGNGFVSNFRELIMEMEIPAFLLNFGIFGFILYFIPFLSIWIYGFYKGIKNIKIIDDEYLMILIGCGFVFALSFFSGYTFFSSSNMIIIVVLNSLLLNKAINLEKLKLLETSKND